MCGIAGYTGQKQDQLLSQMIERIDHRGPDDRGTLDDGLVHLGMSRLAIIDLEGGKQPIGNEDGSIQVVFNGEIFNYIELRTELKTQGHIFLTHTDTEVIVHAYEQYGSDFLNKLNGMFTIALWDRKTETLLVARDRFGVKPLFYHLTADKNLVFASEIKSVLCHSQISRDLSFEALSHFFSLRNIPHPLTVYKNVRALSPGHQLVWRKGHCQIEPWYEIPTYKRVSLNEEDLVDELDELLRDSVRLRMRSDVPYGAYLSGGIDSSLVTAMMSEQTSQRVKTFSLGFADQPEHKKDIYFARQIAEKYQTEHHEYFLSHDDFIKDLPDVISHLDQPFAGVISSYWLSKFIAKHVKVALSGDGADDFFASYGHHRMIWPVLQAQQAQAGKRAWTDVDYSFFPDLKEFINDMAKLPIWESRLAYAAYMESEKKSLFSPKGLDLMGRYSTSEFLRNLYEGLSPELDPLNRVLMLDVKTLLPNEILYFNDMLSMAHSLEVRTPFLDYRIAELATQIPGELKIKGTTLKYILRRVAARYLPEEILQRPKEGFVLPMNTWLKRDDGRWMREILDPARTKLHGYWNDKAVSEWLTRFLKGDDSVTFRVWTLVVFQLWWEQNELG